MNERIQRTGEVKRVRVGGSAGTIYTDIYEVLSENMRDSEFRGTLDECLHYLRSQCPNGKCEN